MAELDLFGGGKEHYWDLGTWFNVDSPYLRINKVIVIDTWIALIILITLLLLARIALRKPKTQGFFIVTSGVKALMDMVEQSLGKFSFTHCCFSSALFIFIVLCNTLAIIPWLEEPTTNLTTTLACSLISFFYIQTWAIKEHGVWGYIKEYFTPIFLMFPIHIMGKLANIISLAFRLLGNIYGGARITGMLLGAIKGNIILELLALCTGVNIIVALFFGLFEGFLQAFVFTTLSLTYLAIALQHSGEAEHGEAS